MTMTSRVTSRNLRDIVYSPLVSRSPWCSVGRRQGVRISLVVVTVLSVIAGRGPGGVTEFSCVAVRFEFFPRLAAGEISARSRRRRGSSRGCAFFFASVGEFRFFHVGRSFIRPTVVVLAPESTRCGKIYRGFPNRSVEDW